MLTHKHENTLTEIDKKEAIRRAATLCSRHECCVSEIQQKLVQWETDPNDRDAIISYLIEEKYIDERRYCRAYALDKMRYNHWGRVKIDQMLRLLQVDREARINALTELPEEEYKETLRHVAQSKLSSIKARNDYERRTKLIRFLLGRGFEMDLIRDIVDVD